MGLLRSYLSFFLEPSIVDSKTKYLIFWVIFSLTGLMVSNPGIPSIMLTVKIAALVASITAFVYFLNDAMDADMDALNPVKSGRPIPAGIATKYQALQISVIGGVIGIAIAFTFNVSILIFSLIYMILGFMYSAPPFNFKKKLLMKEIIPILGFFLVTSISSLASGSIRPSIFYISVYWALFVLTITPTFHDALDLEEDRIHGCKTIAILLNQKRRLELSIIGLILMMATSPFSFIYFGFNVAFPILICVACLLFLRFFFPMLLEKEEVERSRIEKGDKIMQVFLLVMLAAFVLGSLKIL